MSELSNRIENEAGLRELGKTIRDLAAQLTEERVGRAITPDGKVNFNSGTGVVPVANMAFVDHDHNGDPRHGQKLDALNTHEDAILGDDVGAIHWTEAALIALILANSPPPSTRWEPLANGDPDDPALVFADGDVIMIEVPL